ncbi:MULTISPECIES: DUF4761 family protein [Serratia]|uniref:DUF4761 family protein n=1 Tax=Serratia TaxID=613 RepID=UPI001934756B|nr:MULTISPECIES: DUF4761 family protein [Serratia]UJD79844.1 DUF4761 family protein [Serratia rubidaea]UJD84400.1 DUF4761 family protein [Serratia rubidaea]WBF43746.1 DUF4761 family protein [Serratia rubidaea]CAE1145036.1 conserved protein of unknown function [Serratia sp. Tan611]
MQHNALIQLSKHTFVYRGFTIQKCPRHSATERTAYQLMSNGDYFGRDFALAEAMRTIDTMLNSRGKA